MRWITAWNQHDLDAILALYSPTIRHTSTKISTYFDVSDNTLEGKENLRSYFQQALANNPNLTFDLTNILVGESSVVVLYIRMGKNLAGEYLEFDEEGLIIRSRSHYSNNI